MNIYKIHHLNRDKDNLLLVIYENYVIILSLDNELLTMCKNNEHPFFNYFF